MRFTRKEVLMAAIVHSRPTTGKEELAAAARVVRSAQLSAGPEVAAFEEEMARVLAVKGAAAVSSGSAALHLALAGLRLGAGDEVILPTYVPAALLNAVYYVGARPVLADVRFEDGNIDPKDAARRINPRTRAILVAHMFGFPADMKALLKLGVPLIEDCAQAAGAKVGRKFVGSMGRAGVLSFNAAGMIACGEGGMVVSDDESLMKEARDLASYDHRPDYRLRFNYRMTDLQAAIGRAQLKKLPSMITARKRIAAEYVRMLKKTGVELPVQGPGTVPSFTRFVIKGKDPLSLMALMKKKGIGLERPLFRPLHYYLGLTGYPVADRLQQESVSLPIYPSLSRGEMTRIKKELVPALLTTAG